MIIEIENSGLDYNFYRSEITAYFYIYKTLPTDTLSTDIGETEETLDDIIKNFILIGIIVMVLSPAAYIILYNIILKVKRLIIKFFVKTFSDFF